MNIKITIDRFENDKAVLSTEDGKIIVWPKSKLPDGAHESMVLNFNILNDSEILIKRILLTGKKREFDKVSMNIKVYKEIRDVIIDADPEVQSTINLFKSTGNVTIIEVVFSGFSEDQRAAVSLLSTDVQSKSTIVVEVIGSYGNNKYTGASAIGSME